MVPFWLGLIPTIFFAAGISDSSNMSKYILVTGGNKGIGKAICQGLIQQYPDVHVFLGARNQERGEAAVKDIGGDRVSFVQLDASDDSSVKGAASTVQSLLGGKPLYGIVNNAGIAWGNPLMDIVNINYFGTKRVCEAFGPMLQHPGGRIVNTASASGPMFVSDCSDSDLKAKLADPSTTSLEEVEQIARTETSIDNGYGFSKALVNAYTTLLAKHPDFADLIVNACTPGYIKTDLAPGGSGTVEKGASVPIALLMDEKFNKIPTGRYYGSDVVRSPLNVYRGPGDPAYEGP
jgi:carbonyl reductase 1